MHFRLGVSLTKTIHVGVAIFMLMDFHGQHPLWIRIFPYKPHFLKLIFTSRRFFYVGENPSTWG